MKSKAKGTTAITVDEYLSALPEKERKALETVRQAIKTAAPKAEELMSYQIPTYKHLGPLVHFAAFKNHCSLFAVSKHILEIYEKELVPFKTAGTTIQFSADSIPPVALVKKIVKLRVQENEALYKLKKTGGGSSQKEKGLSVENSVTQFMSRLQSPLKNEIEAVRKIIKGANEKLSERIKWNAPSYYYKKDIVTFHTRPTSHVHLVFHHPFIVQINSPLLEGDYKDRRMVYLKDMKEIKGSKKELERILNEVIRQIDKETE